MRGKSNISGFTLVELSIVIILIGLIVVSIIGGQSLIRAGKLRSVISEVEGLKRAVYTFELHYDALPGDMKNASEYWPVDCVDIGANLCNGNNNQQIEWLIGSLEGLRAWQHLSLAEIISGSYTGDDILGRAIVGENVPALKIGGGAGIVSPYLVVGGEYLNDHYDPASKSLFSPVEARTIDIKADDGLPDTGYIVGDDGIDISVEMLPHTCRAGANYNLSESAPSCWLAWRIFE